MKPAVDEMFPEGAGPYVDLDEGQALESASSWTSDLDATVHILPAPKDCTSPEDRSSQWESQTASLDKDLGFVASLFAITTSALLAGGSTGLLMDLAANEKAVHLDYFNSFEDMFDDDDID